VYAADELLEHLFGNGEVGDHAVLHGTNGSDVARCAAQHLLCSETDLLDDFFAVGSAFLTDRNY
jgi:hypothetical protein